MSAVSRVARVLDAAAMVCIVATVALLLWPTTPHPRALSIPVPPAAAVMAAVPRDSIAERIVSTNIFGASRRAPRSRFVPPGADETSVAAAPTMDDGTVSAGSAADPAGAPRLFGIVVQDGVRRALLQLPGSDSIPRLLAVGDRQRGYRVVSIDADRVVLASSAGSRTVRLMTRASSDSLENMP
jgi:hypothetical protein